MDAPQNEKKKNDDRQRNADQKKEGAPFHGFPPKRETRAPFKAEAAPAAAVRKDKTVRLGTAPKRGKFLPARSAWVARLIIRYFDVGQTEKTCMSAIGTADIGLGWRRKRKSVQTT